LLYRLMAVARRKRLEDELDEEIRGHIEMAAEVSVATARRTSEFGLRMALGSFKFGSRSLLSAI